MPAGRESQGEACIGITSDLRLIQHAEPGPWPLFHKIGTDAAALFENHRRLPHSTAWPCQRFALLRTVPVLERLAVQVEREARRADIQRIGCQVEACLRQLRAG